MTCHHEDGDPKCTTWPSRVKEAEAFLAKARRLGRPSKSGQPSPDPKDYSIEDAYTIGERHLVLKVRYHNCKSCAFEGVKVMVFLDVPSKAALLWREIDPHFRDPKIQRQTQAPSPAARFPGSEQGWKDALAYARSRTKDKT